MTETIDYLIISHLFTRIPFPLLH